MSTFSAQTRELWDCRAEICWNLAELCSGARKVADRHGRAAHRLLICTAWAVSFSLRSLIHTMSLSNCYFNTCMGACRCRSHVCFKDQKLNCQSRDWGLRSQVLSTDTPLCSSHSKHKRSFAAPEKQPRLTLCWEGPSFSCFLFLLTAVAAVKQKLE